MIATWNPGYTTPLRQREGVVMNSKFNRRSFLKFIAVIFGTSIASACECFIDNEPEKSSTTVTTTPTPASTATSTPSPWCTEENLNNLAQPFEITGERYKLSVPDTLDLQERAEITINALTRCTNPDENYDAYFSGELRRNPPVMYRQMPFPQDFMGKWWEGLGLLRYVTGSTFNNYVDQHWREIFVEWFVKYSPLLEGPGGGRLLCWIANNYRLEKNICWAAIAEQAVGTLLGTLSRSGDVYFFTDANGVMETGWDATYRGWTLQGVTSIYAATGDSAAKRLADGLARYLKDYARIFDVDGSFLASQQSITGNALHFHHNGNTMVGISEYALATGDQEYAAFAQKGYEYALSSGLPLVGFFPEYIDYWNDTRPFVPNETCCTVDMIMLAINLTKIGQGDYWDDVDRYVRNQFIEMQMRDGNWIIQTASNHGNQPVEDGEDGDQIADRVVGSFAGWASANDYQASINEPFISACCTGNAARAIFYVWENMIEYNHGMLKLNLLFNRVSPWADILSYIPYEGRVDIKMKTAAALGVRIPEWVNTRDVTCSVDEMTTQLSFRGRYALVNQVQVGSLVTLNFPISERTVQEEIGDVPYTFIIKGNDVVSIDPPGSFHPFYTRAKYRTNEARWVTRKRFVAS